MGKTTVTTSVDVNVTVDVQAKFNAAPDVDNQDQDTDLTMLILPVSILGGAGALALAFYALGMMAFVGLGGLVVAGGAVFFLYDHGPDLLNDWHYRRLERQRVKQLAATRPIVIVVQSQEEAKKLADQMKVLEVKR